jgi:hypothetical protein
LVVADVIEKKEPIITTLEKKTVSFQPPTEEESLLQSHMQFAQRKEKKLKKVKVKSHLYCILMYLG